MTIQTQAFTPPLNFDRKIHTYKPASKAKKQIF